MLLTWQKWQIQPTGTTSSIRLSQLLVSRPYSALASVLPGIQPADKNQNQNQIRLQMPGAVG